ncbi:MAG: protoporphyrinogen oxidase [Planctomycetota bacterium]|jgi:oxygen-dependent protoporphyrinogen oxidase|nr:protoporphyrinogen oxidase [Planctomycetota bacterium]
MQQSSDSIEQVIVVGGGLAGLAAAEELLRCASGLCEVTIVEASERPGGVVASVRHDGWLTERSADSFLAARPEGIQLIERLGLADELVGIPPAVRRALILHKGRLVPVPAGFRLLAPGQVRSILTTPLLSLSGKLRLLCEPLIRCGHGEDESLEQFAVRRLGREAFERLVQPLVSGIWTADPARLSMAAACPDFLAMERHDGSLFAGERARLRFAPRGQAASGARYGQFVSLASGMETLPRRLAEHVRAAGGRFIRGRTLAVRRHAARWQVEVEGQSALAADAVILALPAPAAAMLLNEADSTLATLLAKIEYAGSAVVSLGYARSDVAHPLDAAGIVVPRREGRKILAISFLSSKFPDRAPKGHVLIRVFVGGALDPGAAQLDDTALLARVRYEAADLLGIRGEPKLTQIDRWHAAMPQYHVGHVSRVAAIRARAATLPRLALAGAAYEGVGIPQVIASGQRAAVTVGYVRNDRSKA